MILVQCFLTSSMFSQFMTIIALIRFPLRSTCLSFGSMSVLTSTLTEHR